MTKKITLSLPSKKTLLSLSWLALPVIAILALLIDPYWSSSTLWFFRWITPYLILTLILPLIPLLFLSMHKKKEYDKHQQELSEKNRKRFPLTNRFYYDYGNKFAVSMYVAMFLLLLLGVGGSVYTKYLTEATYAESVAHPAQENTEALSYQQRVPFEVAQAQSKTALQDMTGATLITDNSRYNPHTEEFSTLVKGRQVLGNYAAIVEQTSTLVGRNSAEQCVFPKDSNKMLNGWLTHNLGRSINAESRMVKWDAEDAYGYCDGDTPKVVVPLKMQKGFFPVIQVPAGAAVYDGATGEVSITKNPDDVPGVVYPMSVAAKQRESLNATGSFIDFLRNRVGYDVAENAHNQEMVVGGEDGTHYVTMLSPIGNSENVVAVSDISADDSVPGELAPLNLHKVQWSSLSAINDRIRADYQDIPNWQSIQVQEIIPISSTTWVATIGNEQNILYRVSGTGNLADPMPGQDEAVTCLTKGKDADPIRCGTEALKGGQGIGGQYGPRDSDESSGGGGGGSREFADMSIEELFDLTEKINEELRNRFPR